MRRNRVNEKPADYDVDGWLRYYAEHPGIHRSVGADGQGEGGGGGGGDGGGRDPNGDGGGDNGGGSENWRSVFLSGLEGDDLTKEQKRIERFTKPQDLWKSFREFEGKISAGEFLRPLPKDATEDDIKRFREQQGIPLEAKAYLENLPEGLVIGEDDMPTFEKLAESMHAVNAPPAMVHKVVEFYNSFMEEAEAARQESDEKLRDEIEDTFREEWGPEFRKNTNLINALIDSQFSAEDAELFRSARLADGTPLMSSPGVLRTMVNMAREINPAGALIEGGGDPNKGLDDAIAEIEKTMRTNRAAYNADIKMQERYRDLLDARIKRDEKSGVRAA